MNYFFIGKIIGGLIGFFTFGPLGAIAGVLAGHIFDKGLSQVKQDFSPQKREQIQKAFFTAIFPLLGYLAKADGRVSEEEISHAEALFAKMGLDNVQKMEAIRLFKSGAGADFSVDKCIGQFLAIAGPYRDLKQIFLVNLINISLADGELHSAEQAALTDVADKLGYSRVAFNQLLGMFNAQSHFHHYQDHQHQDYQYQNNRYQDQQPFTTDYDQLQIAYDALGVDKSANDADVKKAYRKLMSEYHPDKLSGRGVPENMVKLATERSQEIQAAYDLVKKHRAKNKT